ncbi:hypothetical protein FWJ25_04425 [Marinobacter salinexigens]|uniref:Uncharacterized protein n=1 Tax=Marinobacter salinexigens TaxID=2919747 RepID=A0A5B0VR32_9GAMM|nr:hypothetical protein [Marinobacter salinexigens]KAA1176381.1 hypothetical protein FWJ25_04425 [Marinobacter salinexigens]
MQPRFSLILSCTMLVIAGCGGSGDAIDAVRSDPNDFAGTSNPVDDFSSGSTGDSSNAGDLANNEVRITMEVPGSIAPDAELTRRNLRIVQPDRLSVYETNPALQNLGSVDTSTRIDSNGHTIITFAEGLPLAPDVIIEASYGNIRMRAFAADADQDVKVNPFSEYLVRNTLPDYTSGEFQSILDCVGDAGGQLCLNKYVWSTIADQVHDFEIDIPDSANLDSALALLDDHGDFASYVASMADYALLNDTSSGKISATSADYNSVFLGVELGQTFMESSLSGSGQWGVRTAQEELVQDTNGSAYIYPGLTLTSFDAFNIKVTSLASDIPYDRETLIHQAGNTFFSRGADQWELNTHASSPGAATLLSDTRLLAGRALYQSITGRNSSRIIGWTRNPYYLDAYTSTPVDDTTGPDRLVSGYFSSGKAIELQASGDSLSRLEVLENQHVSVLELDLLRQEGFDAGTLDNRHYNVVYLALQFDDGALSPTAPSTATLTVESGVGSWQIIDGSITQSHTTDTVLRDNSGAVGTATGTRSGTWTLSDRTSRLSDQDKDIGRLNLDITTESSDFEQPDLGIGAATPDGTMMAFNLDDSPFGDGLLIAAERTGVAAPSSGRYRLQGLTMGLGADTNHLRHFDNAELSITSAASAALTLSTLDITHKVSEESVSSPVLNNTPDMPLAYSASGNGRVELSNGDLTLDGFHTADGDQFYFRIRNTTGDEEQIGLVIATRLP